MSEMLQLNSYTLFIADRRKMCKKCWCGYEDSFLILIQNALKNLKSVYNQMTLQFNSVPLTKGGNSDEDEEWWHACSTLCNALLHYITLHYCITGFKYGKFTFSLQIKLEKKNVIYGFWMESLSCISGWICKCQFFKCIYSDMAWKFQHLSG